MKRRGFIFTLDALLSLILVMVVVGSMVSIIDTTNVYSTSLREGSKYKAEDVLTTLRNVPLKELVPPEILENWSREGIIESPLVNEDMSPLDIVATYWATRDIFPEKNLTHKAELILGYLLNKTLEGYYYELLINNYTSPYLRKVGADYSQALEVSPATLTLSGYAYNQTPRGYMARAYLRKLGRKENTCVVRGSYIESAAPNSSKYVIIKYIIPAGTIPQDATIEEVKWFIEGAWTESTYRLYINGNPVTCTGEITGNRYDTWSLVDTNDLIEDSTNGDLCNLVEEVQEAVQNGDEVVFEVQNYNDNYEWRGEYVYRGGEDGAQYIKINYTTSTPSTIRFPKRFHFEDISSYYGMKIIKFLFTPGKLNSLNIQLTVENVPESEQDNPHFVKLYFFNEDIGPIYPSTYSVSGDTVTYYWSNTTISSALSGYGISYDIISSKVTPVEIVIGDIDTSYSSQRLHVVGNSSFIEADYITDILLTRYSIDITKPITDYSAFNCDSPSGSSWCRDITWSFEIPDSAIPLWMLIQTPWLYYIVSSAPTPRQEITIDNDAISPTYLYKHPPNPFMHVLARIGYAHNTFDYQNNQLNNAIVEGTNTVHVSLETRYWLQPSNGHGEFTYLLQAYAGYGDVFPKLARPECEAYNITYYWIGDISPHYVIANLTGIGMTSGNKICNVTTSELLANRTMYAIDDAIIRLFNNLGGNGTATEPLLVELPANVNIDFASMGNIPGLFEPIQITLRVWRES